MEPEEPEKDHPAGNLGGVEAQVAALLQEKDFDSMEQLEADILRAREAASKYEKDNKHKKKAEELDKLKKLEALRTEIQNLFVVKSEFKVSTDNLLKKMSQLLEECSLESPDNIDEDILEMEDIIEGERREGSDTSALEASLLKLREIRALKAEILNSPHEKVAEVSMETEEEILMRQLRTELELLKINEDEFEQKLADCKKKIKAFTTAKKSAAEIEPYQVLERKLLKVLEIRNKIQQLRGEPLIEYKSKKLILDQSCLFPSKEESSPRPLASPTSKLSAATPTSLRIRPEETPMERFIQILEQGREPRRILYQPTLSCKDLLSELKVEDPERTELQVREAGAKEFKPLQPDQLISSQMPDSNIECMLMRRYLVKGPKGVDYFVKGTSCDRIKKNMLAKDCVFFNAQYEEVDEDEISQDLVLLDCQKCNVLFRGETFRKKLVPVTVPIRDVLNYLMIKGPETLYVSAAKINDRWVRLSRTRCLMDECKGADIQELRLSYTIQLSIEINTPQGNRFVEYTVSSTETIQELKEGFEDECKFKAKLQKWIINEREIEGDNLTFEDMGLDHTRYRVEVQEILNLEYYGFSQQTQVKAEAFREFYVENDEEFTKEINDSSFPSTAYEYSFRVMTLGVIFAAVKKHCRIQSAISSIRQLVAHSQKPVSLWRAKSAKEKSFFNEHYALHNILHSGDDDLKIEFMRVYKSHSPLPLVSRNAQNICFPFYEHHFWVCNKSFTIVSLEVAGTVKGKSTFLNRIFGTDFEVSSKRHPICDNSVYVQYNVYRNDNLMVDLVDVSSDSITDDAKVELCQASNLVIVHYAKSNEAETREWLKLKCPGVPSILIERDSHIMDVPENFTGLLKSNRGKKTDLNYGVPEMDDDNVRYYSDNLNFICDQIHSLIKEFIKSPETDQAKWRFMEFLSTKGKKNHLTTFMGVLKKVEDKFSDIIDAQAIFSADPESAETPEQRDILSATLKMVIDVIDPQQIDRNMSKLREAIRIIRTNRLSVFSQLSEFQKLLEGRNDETLKSITEELSRFFERMDSIPFHQTTSKFREATKKFRTLKSEQLTAAGVNHIMSEMRESFNYDIKPRQFSIENFWRGLAKFLATVPDAQDPLADKIRQIYAREFAGSKTFEVINGQTLEMPTALLRSNLLGFGETKKIMVVGIFGPQSSGKSTLLNFLFGCDFLSSDGRCTSGVYGTYYQINNRNILNCNGVLLLDTEGLFANYDNKRCKGRQNFDNKLVLFLLKTCDVLIMNTRGDVDKNCENILELAFDCDLMEHKPGSRYPNFYMVLNQSAGTMNEQQQNEIQSLRSKILHVAPHMEEYISTSESNSMPLAFNTRTQEVSSKIMKEMQLANKTPTEEFYASTKNLSARLMKIMEGRGRRNQGRTLCDIYDEMDRVWATILKIPMLTKYSSRKLKDFEGSVTKWKYDRNREMQRLINDFKMSIPSELKDLDVWEKERELEVRTKVEEIVRSYHKAFPEGDDVQRNIMINLIAQDIGPKLLSYFDALRIEIASNRYKMEIKQSEERGLDDVCQVARQLRHECFTKGIEVAERDKEQKFEQVWSRYAETIRSKFDRSKSSRETYRQLCELYENQLRCSSEKIQVQANSGLPLCEDTSFAQYAQTATELVTDSAKEENYMFENTETQPIICTPRTGATDITFKYLDMRKFFEFEKISIPYYLRKETTKECIDQQNLRYRIAELLSRERFIQDYASTLEKQVGQFQVRLIGFKQHLANIFVKRFNRDFTPVELKKAEIIPGSASMDMIAGFHNKKIPNFVINHLTGLEASIVREYHEHNHEKSAKHIFQRAISEAVERFVRSYSLDRLHILVKQCYQPLNNQTECCFQQLGLEPEVKLEDGVIQVKSKTPHMRITNLNQLHEIIDSFPPFLKKYIIKNGLTVSKGKDSTFVAEMDSERITICRKFTNEKVLRMYAHKQYKELIDGVKTPSFKKFVHRFVDYEKIIKYAVDMVRQLPPEIEMKASISQCIIELKKQIGDFNKDLQQISQQLSYRFVTDLHDLCLHLLWKLHEERVWETREEVIGHVEQQRDNQHKIFMGYLDTDVKKNSESNALIFVQKYTEHILAINEKEKQRCITEKRNDFLQKYSRSKVQELVDSRMATCVDEDPAYQYLVHPERVLQELYNNLIDTDTKDLVDNFTSEAHVCYKELEARISKIRQQTKGDHENWFSDQLFVSVKQAPQKVVRDIFVELFNTGKTLNSDTQSSVFQLKPGNVEFKLSSKLNQQGNISFFKADLLHNMEISNYSLFISSLEEKLKENFNSLAPKLEISESQKNFFRQQVKLILCPSKCYCCKRLCDIDMRLDEHHKIHKCQYGHQMRAISGIRIQRKRGGATELYASVKRCEDIEEMSSFQFNSQEITWKDFCERKKDEWDFKQSPLVTQNHRLIFVNLWKLAGKRICQDRIAEDSQDMIYLEYDQASIEFSNKVQPECQYVFAIDGSGSMSGTPWNEQLTSLKDILVDLSNSSNNRVSIIVFHSTASVYCENRDASTINVNAINFPGGGTQPSAAFSQANQIMKTYAGKMNLYFVYISDGIGPHPTAEIQQMLLIKASNIAAGFTFNYASILIGGSSGAPAMDTINHYLKGTSNFVMSAAQIGKKFKEIMNVKM